MSESITLKAKVKTPEVPDFVEISNVRHAYLDDAIANKNKSPLVVDVAALDDKAIEEIGRQWTDALLKRSKQRRVKAEERVQND